MGPVSQLERGRGRGPPHSILVASSWPDEPLPAHRPRRGSTVQAQPHHRRAISTQRKCLATGPTHGHGASNAQFVLQQPPPHSEKTQAATAPRRRQDSLAASQHTAPNETTLNDATLRELKWSSPAPPSNTLSRRYASPIRRLGDGSSVEPPDPRSMSGDHERVAVGPLPLARPSSLREVVAMLLNIATARHAASQRRLHHHVAGSSRLLAFVEEQQQRPAAGWGFPQIVRRRPHLDLIRTKRWANELATTGSDRSRTRTQR